MCYVGTANTARRADTCDGNNLASTLPISVENQRRREKERNGCICMCGNETALQEVKRTQGVVHPTSEGRLTDGAKKQRKPILRVHPESIRPPTTSGTNSGKRGVQETKQGWGSPDSYSILLSKDRKRLPFRGRSNDEEKGYSDSPGLRAPAPSATRPLPPSRLPRRQPNPQTTKPFPGTERRERGEFSRKPADRRTWERSTPRSNNGAGRFDVLELEGDADANDRGGLEGTPLRLVQV